MADEQMSKLLPWARFKLVSKDPAEESDHLYFFRSSTTIGRNRARCDVVLDQLFISGMHCTITLEGQDDQNNPFVSLKDLSRNGVYVNEEIVGKNKSTKLFPNVTIHFTKPGLQAKNVPPTVFKFEILPDGLSPANDQLRKLRDQQPRVTKTATPSGAAAASALKRKRGDAENVPGAQQVEEVDPTKSLTKPDEFTTPVTQKRARFAPTKPSAAVESSARDGDDEKMIGTISTIQKSNQGLRQRLQDAVQREEKLKAELSELHCAKQELDDQVAHLMKEVGSMKHEVNEKAGVMEEQSRRIDELLKEKIATVAATEKAKEELNEALKEITRHEETIERLQHDRDKLEGTVSTMTKSLEGSVARIQMLEDQLKKVQADNGRLERVVDSMQSRSEIVEEGKRGVHEENVVLKSRLASVGQLIKNAQELLVRGHRIALEDSVDSQDSEDPRRTSQLSVFSSEYSEPTPQHENYCADTQPEDMDMDDEEATVDPDAVAIPRPSPRRENESTECLDDETSRPVPEESKPYTEEEKFEEDTAALSELKPMSGSSDASVVSGSLSDNPPAPPPVHTRERDQQVVASETTVQEESSKESPEEQETKSSAENEAATIDTTAPAGDDSSSKAKEDDKENAPVRSLGKEGGTLSGAQKSTTSGSRGRWLQILPNADDSSDSIPGQSEGGNIFDDETQLSD